MAIGASVTVSMPALNTGIFKFKFEPNCVEVFTSRGKTSLAAGISKTSSKVNPNLVNLSDRFKIYYLHAYLK